MVHDMFTGGSAVERQQMREAIAKQLGIQLAAMYTIPSVASILGVDESTVKRWKRDGKTEYVQLGRGVRFFGWQICDLLINGIRREQAAKVEA